MRNSCVVEEEKERKKKRNEWSGKLFQRDEGLFKIGSKFILESIHPRRRRN